MGKHSPAADTKIDEHLVLAILAEQHPDLADYEVNFVAEGWDNAQYRLGEGWSFVSLDVWWQFL